MIIAVIAILTLIGGLLYWAYPKKQYKNKNTNIFLTLVQQGDSLFNESKYENAITKFKQAENLTDVDLSVVTQAKVEDKITKAENRKAEYDLKERANNEFTAGDLEKYKKVVQMLENANIDGYDPKNDIENYRQRSVSAYENKIQTERKLQEQQKYANIITTELGEPDNAVATAALKGKQATATPANTDGCKITHKYDDRDKKDAKYTVDELLTKAKKSLTAKSYQIVYDACDAIIKYNKRHPNCVTKKQLEKANDLIEQVKPFKK